MHMCWLGGHFDEEYTPWEYLRRGAKASLSVIRLPSPRKTASVPATSRNPRPRTRSAPCWTTAARKTSRCSAAQHGPSSIASTRSIGGFPGCTSTLSSEVGDEDDISVSFQSLKGNRDVVLIPDFLSVAAAQDDAKVTGAARSRCSDLPPISD